MDIILMFIPGGPTHDFNFVPQTSNVNRGTEGSFWFRVEHGVREFLATPNAGRVEWNVVVTYADIQTNRRPTGFAVQSIRFDNNGNQVQDSGNMYFSNQVNADCDRAEI
jgi:hypothetical protein